MALAKVAMVAARTDPARAGQIALGITGQLSPTTAEGKGQRKAPPPPSMLGDPIQAIYWKVRALTEIAIVVTGADTGRSVRLPDDAERVSRPIAPHGTVRDGVPTRAETAAAQIDPAQAGQLLTEAEQYARAISRSDLQGIALTSVKTAAAQIDPAKAAQLLTEAEQHARAISGASARLEALGLVALAAAHTRPALAEQVIRDLPPDAPERAEVALAAARTDPACGERIAASAGGYLQALVRAVVAVRADPADAGPLLEQAVQAAGNDPAHVAEIATVVALADRARAEQVARTIKAGAGMAAGYWGARTLANLADICLGGYAR
jgi:hypothetical protein